jgi:hypothetical protein
VVRYNGSCPEPTWTLSEPLTRHPSAPGAQTTTFAPSFEIPAGNYKGIVKITRVTPAPPARHGGHGGAGGPLVKVPLAAPRWERIPIAGLIAIPKGFIDAAGAYNDAFTILPAAAAAAAAAGGSATASGTATATVTVAPSESTSSLLLATGSAASVRG